MRIKGDIFMELVNEAVENYFKTYSNKNSIDAERIAGMCDELQEMYDSLISNGDSPHEITALSLQRAIKELKDVVKMMR